MGGGEGKEYLSEKIKKPSAAAAVVGKEYPGEKYIFSLLNSLRAAFSLPHTPLIL